MRSVFILSVVLSCASLCTAAYTIFDFWWLGSSVVAMSEELERVGIIDSARAAEFRTSGSSQYTSTGEFLMQRHDRSVATGLYLLSGISSLGFALIARASHAARRSSSRSRPSMPSA